MHLIATFPLLLAVAVVTFQAILLWKNREFGLFVAISTSFAGVLWLAGSFLFLQRLLSDVLARGDHLFIVYSIWLPDVLGSVVGAILLFGLVPFGLWRYQTAR